LDELRRAASGCTGCDLYRDATQTVFGDGPSRARAVLVGEQPGDQEDRAGEPFVGPAGRLLDRALDDAGIDRDQVYVTNAVKHFKFHLDERGKRRIHEKPSRGEVVACRPWLLAELGAIRPGLVVCLGATAAQSLLGTAFRLTKQRGELVALPPDVGLDGHALATVHPSAVLRAPDRDLAYKGLVEDLTVAARAIA
jgi:DNA polymerase